MAAAAPGEPPALRSRRAAAPLCAALALVSTVGALAALGAGRAPARQEGESAGEPGPMRIAILGSSHAAHVGAGLQEVLPPADFEVRDFTTDAATMWKNVSWCGGIHFPIWKFLPGVDAYSPHVVILSTGASDSRGCFWDPEVEGRPLGAYYGQNLKQMVARLTARGYYVLFVTPPAFLRGRQIYGNCDSAEKLFGHGDPKHCFNRSRIDTSVVPLQRYLATRMWNVGLYDLHALTRDAERLGRTSAIYRDCAHLKDASAAYELYGRLRTMLESVREAVLGEGSAQLCASVRCRRHNAEVAPDGAPVPEPFVLDDVDLSDESVFLLRRSGPPPAVQYAQRAGRRLLLGRAQPQWHERRRGAAAEGAAGAGDATRASSGWRPVLHT